MFDIMYEYMDIILAFLSGVVFFITKHPFAGKMMIASIFFRLITYVSDYFKNLISPYILDNSLLSLSAYFGILDGLSLYLTIVLAGFGMKQILAFVRS